MPRPRQEVLEDEWLIVRHSGEIPEIALHSTFYYLTEDPDGPQLQLSIEEIQYLQEAAAARYQEIILRDLCYENRELTIYRGMQRAIFNWHRFVAFCERQKYRLSQLTQHHRRSLPHFTEQSSHMPPTRSRPVLFSTAASMTSLSLPMNWESPRSSSLQISTFSAIDRIMTLKRAD